MRALKLTLPALLLLALPVVAQQYSAAPAAEAVNSVPLKMKVYRNWSIKLPAEQWATVGKKFALKEGMGADFKAHLDGTALAVDNNGDGKVDIKVETPSGVVTLSHGDRRYAVRVKTDKQQWRFAPACAMWAKVDGTKVRFIDQNNNGRFNDIGADAMIVGNGKVASLLSEVASINGKLYKVAVDTGGTNLTFSPYVGATSTLKLDAATRGKVVAAVVTSADGKYSFGFSGARNEAVVPAQDYRLHSGVISFGGNTVRVKSGRSRAVSLPKDGSASLSWGGPIHAEFTYARKGDEIEFDPNAIWYFGKNGEEYYGWTPLGKSPKITLNTTSGRELAQAYFPGS